MSLTEKEASLLRTISVLAEPLSDEGVRWLIDSLQDRLDDGFPTAVQDLDGGLDAR